NSETATRGMSSRAHCRNSSADGLSVTDLAGGSSIKPLSPSELLRWYAAPPVFDQSAIDLGVGASRHLPPGQGRLEIVDRHLGHRPSRADAGRAEMRGDEHVGEAEEGMGGGQGLRLGDVER